MMKNTMNVQYSTVLYVIPDAAYCSTEALLPANTISISFEACSSLNPLQPTPCSVHSCQILHRRQRGHASEAGHLKMFLFPLCSMKVTSARSARWECRTWPM